MLKQYIAKSRELKDFMESKDWKLVTEMHDGKDRKILSSGSVKVYYNEEKHKYGVIKGGQEEYYNSPNDLVKAASDMNLALSLSDIRRIK